MLLPLHIQKGTTISSFSSLSQSTAGFCKKTESSGVEKAHPLALPLQQLDSGGPSLGYKQRAMAGVSAWSEPTGPWEVRDSGVNLPSVVEPVALFFPEAGWGWWPWERRSTPFWAEPGSHCLGQPAGSRRLRFHRPYTQFHPVASGKSAALGPPCSGHRRMLTPLL